jgi:N-acetylglucosamine-6-phosphate deacetylase
VPLEEAARRCATLPADHLGLEERGRLVPGAVADVVVLDREGRLQAVLIEGQAIPAAGG